jgi:hypothetical protein
MGVTKLAAMTRALHSTFAGMRAVIVGCAIVVGCGGGGGTPTGDGGGNDGTNPNATAIMFTLNNVPNDAGVFAFVAAYQDGDGAWKPAPARSGDTYAFDVSSGTWGFAYTCQVNVNVNGVPTALRNVLEYHFAVAERTSWTEDILARCTDRIAYVQLSGNILNPLRGTNSGTYRVAYNGTAVFINKTLTTATYAMLVAPGTHDLLVLHGNDRNTPGDFLVDGAIVQRNVAVTAAMTRDVDVQAAVATRQLTFSLPASGAPMSSETSTDLITANGTVVPLAGLTKTPLVSPALATSQGAAGDVYDQRATVEFVKNQAVTVSTATTTPANVPITAAPTPLGATTTMSAATMPYPRFMSTWPGYAGAVGYTWTLAQTPPAAGCGGSACTITWTAWISPGAAGAMPSYKMPDLSQLPGWSQALQFVAGTMATGEVTAMTSSAGAMDFPPPPPPAGTQRLFAHSTFTVTP